MWEIIAVVIVLGFSVHFIVLGKSLAIPPCRGCGDKIKLGQNWQVVWPEGHSDPGAFHTACTPPGCKPSPCVWCGSENCTGCW